MQGTVYTETVVHMPPAALLDLAPYQLVMIDLETGQRVTGRSEGPRLSIGDKVDLLEERDGVKIFARSQA
jgi:uncharacterized OB-fold protein